MNQFFYNPDHECYAGQYHSDTSGWVYLKPLQVETRDSAIERCINRSRVDENRYRVVRINRYSSGEEPLAQSVVWAMGDP